MAEQNLAALIRDRVDAVELVGRYVRLIRAGRHYKALCPFHQEKTPSFYLSPDRGLWYCFGCGAGGTVLDFVQKMEGLTFSETLQKLASELGIPYRPREQASYQESVRQRLLLVNKAAQTFFRASLRQAVPAQEYVKKRMISPESVDRFGLGYAPPRWDGLIQFLTDRRLSVDDAYRVGLLTRTADGRLVDRFRDRLMFPIHSLTGEIVGFGGRIIGDGEPKYLNVPESVVFQKRKTLYGFHLARTAIKSAGEVLLVEGYLDCISLHQAGFLNTVATMGAALSGPILQILQRLTRRLVVAYDADSAGLNAILRSSDLFRQYDLEVLVVRLPAGTDPDNFIRAEGPEAFRTLIGEAHPLISFRTQMFLSQHPSPTPDSLQAATRFLRSITSPTDQEEIVEMLARDWSGQEPERITALRQALLRSLAHQWRMGRPSGQPHLVPQPEPDPITRALTDASELPHGVAVREEELMSALVQDEQAAVRIFSLMSPEEFFLSGHRELASLVYSYLQSGRYDELSTAIEEMADPETQRLYARLSVRDLSFLKAKNALEDRIALQKQYRKRQEFKKIIRELEEKAKRGTPLEDPTILDVLRSLKGP